MHKSEITIELIKQLLEEQFPQWAELPIRPVEKDGWDNLTMRLGDTMSVRFPSAEMYSPQVEKEHRWLPVLRQHLPVAIPNPLGKGVPGAGFPRPWSVYEWLPGQQATPQRVSDPVRMAEDLSGFLTAMHQIDATGGPKAGLHSFYRGAGPAHWDDSARSALTDLIDASAAFDVWQTALSTEWDAAPVWFHGDMSGSNLLVRDGKLSAIIDFGTCGVGDPAAIWSLRGRSSTTPAGTHSGGVWPWTTIPGPGRGDGCSGKRPSPSGTHARTPRTSSNTLACNSGGEPVLSN